MPEGWEVRYNSYVPTMCGIGAHCGNFFQQWAYTVNITAATLLKSL